MKIYDDNGPKMAAAVDRVFGRQAMLIESFVFDTAFTSSDDYQGGTWAFVTNDDQTLGFWYPTSRDTYAVGCQNYFQREAMDARSFGAACTQAGLNSLIWKLHNEGRNIDRLSDQFHALRNWIYDLGEGDVPFINTADVAGFTD